MRPYRKEKVASLVWQVVGETIAHRLHDPRVAPLTTVTRVEMTGDLLVAKVYLSILGDAAAERRTLAAVRHATGYIQRMVAQRVSMRHCPELRFEIDESVKGVRRTLELLAENRRREPELYESESDERLGGSGIGDAAESADSDAEDAPEPDDPPNDRAEDPPAAGTEASGVTE